MLVKSSNYGQKSKFWTKMQLLVKNPNVGQKCTFWSKISSRNPNFTQQKKIDQKPPKDLFEKSKSWSKIQIFFLDNQSVKNDFRFGEKHEVLKKIEGLQHNLGRMSA